MNTIFVLNACHYLHPYERRELAIPNTVHLEGHEHMNQRTLLYMLSHNPERPNLADLCDEVVIALACPLP